MLLIINENLLSKYKKVQSNTKPKTFAKQNIKCNGRKYDNSCEFYKEYYSGINVSSLVDNIKTYKSYKRHNSDEGYLADLLSDN